MTISGDAVRHASYQSGGYRSARPPHRQFWISCELRDETLSLGAWVTSDVADRLVLHLFANRPCREHIAPGPSFSFTLTRSDWF